MAKKTHKDLPIFNPDPFGCIDEDFEEGLFDERCVANRARQRRRGTMTSISAMEEVVEKARGSELSDKFFKSIEKAARYLCDKFHLTVMQIIIIGILAERGAELSWRGLGCYLGISRLRMMIYSEEMDGLVEKGWIDPHGVREGGCQVFEGFKLCRGVVTALRKNEVFKPEDLSGKSIQEFVDRLCDKLDVGVNGYGNSYQSCQDWTMRFIRCNPQLQLCESVEDIEEPFDRFLLINFVVDYAMWAGSAEEGLDIDRIDSLFPYDHQVGNMRHALEQEKHILQMLGMIEPRCVNGIAEPNAFVLSSEFKEKNLSGYCPNRRHTERAHKSDRLLCSHKEIKERELFFNEEEAGQLLRLGNLLSDDNLDEVRARLEEMGMRRGIACIFHGGPGTGKTESVLQIARKSGRDIMRVDVATLKDKWVGESEKNVRSIFKRYRALCRDMERTPILFFNEADAIFARRIENVKQSVDQMNNALQNIILEEMENLDGILIATTNLAGNLDKAFERRFLFKVKFTSPETDVKARIWKSMLRGSLTDDEIRVLAARYDFSGGQIENVVRKQSIDYVLTGHHAGIDDFLRYCDQEKIGESRPARIGF